jgi:hypothetical protein
MYHDFERAQYVVAQSWNSSVKAPARGSDIAYKYCVNQSICRELTVSR